MSDLLKKLNLLIQAGMNDVLDEVQKATPTPKKFIPRNRLGTDIDREVDQLREQINQALEHEDTIRVKIDEVQQDADELNRQADDAVLRGDDVNARYYLERMYRAQQRKTMLEADLNEHRIATQELILRVNELDATIAEARHREEQAEQSASTEAAELPPQQASAPGDAAQDSNAPTSDTRYDGVRRAQELSEKANRVLSDVLREARERVEQMNELVEAKTNVQQQTTSDVSEQVSETLQQSQIEDDIAARRARLTAAPKNKPNDGTSK